MTSNKDGATMKVLRESARKGGRDCLESRIDHKTHRFLWLFHNSSNRCLHEVQVWKVIFVGPERTGIQLDHGIGRSAFLPRSCHEGVRLDRRTLVESNLIVHRCLEYHSRARTDSLLPHNGFGDITTTILLNAFILLQFNSIKLGPCIHSRKEWFGSSGKNDVSWRDDPASG